MYAWHWSILYNMTLQHMDVLQLVAIPVTKLDTWRNFVCPYVLAQFYFIRHILTINIKLVSQSFILY
jgi:hypothetical protein